MPDTEHEELFCNYVEINLTSSSYGFKHKQR